MAAISKRTQARNEKLLQDLIKNVSGNDRCADCEARNPGWASWSLGIFLCMRCASLHRKLGTHISKVKSLSMDSWSNDQVESMRQIGNTVSNQAFNPRNKKPSIPLDVDEVDHVIETFIRQKYSSKTLGESNSAKPVTSNCTGSTQIADEQTISRPAKPERRLFGLRSASSALPLTRKSQGRSLADSRTPSNTNRWEEPPVRLNKQSRVFGALVGDQDDDLSTKLSRLRDLGFTDEKRNIHILKGLQGDLDRSIDTLIRLGERQSFTSTDDRSSLRSEDRSLSQASQTNSVHTTLSPRSTSGNEFQNDQLARRNHQSSNSNQASTVYAAHTNGKSDPCPVPTSPQTFDSGVNDPRLRVASLDQAFSGMHLVQTPVQQLLFPHATGGYPNHMSTDQGYLAPAVKSGVGVTGNAATLEQSHPYIQHISPTPQYGSNPFYQPHAISSPASPAPPTSNNPFNAPSSLFQSPTGHEVYMRNSNISLNPYSTLVGNSYQMHSPHDQLGSTQCATYTQPSHSTQAPPMAVQAPASSFFNPQIQHASTYPLPGQSVHQHISPNDNINTRHDMAAVTSAQPMQPPQPQMSGLYDKQSILALYKYPHLAPTRSIPENGEHSQEPHTSSTQTSMPTAPKLDTSTPSSTINDAVSSKNPFAAKTVSTSAPLSSSFAEPVRAPDTKPTVATPPRASHKITSHNIRDSMDFGSFHDGRHSPDAFASLSSRLVR